MPIFTANRNLFSNLGTPASGGGEVVTQGKNAVFRVNIDQFSNLRFKEQGAGSSSPQLPYILNKNPGIKVGFNQRDNQGYGFSIFNQDTGQSHTFDFVYPSPIGSTTTYETSDFNTLYTEGSTLVRTNNSAGTVDAMASLFVTIEDYDAKNIEVLESKFTDTFVEIINGTIGPGYVDSIDSEYVHPNIASATRISSGVIEVTMTEVGPVTLTSKVITLGNRSNGPASFTTITPGESVGGLPGISAEYVIDFNNNDRPLAVFTGSAGVTNWTSSTDKFTITDELGNVAQLGTSSDSGGIDDGSILKTSGDYSLSQVDSTFLSGWGNGATNSSVPGWTVTARDTTTLLLTGPQRQEANLTLSTNSSEINLIKTQVGRLPT